MDSPEFVPSAAVEAEGGERVGCGIEGHWGLGGGRGGGGWRVEGMVEGEGGGEGDRLQRADSRRNLVVI